MAETNPEKDQGQLAEKRARHEAKQPYATEVDDREEESKRHEAAAQKPPKRGARRSSPT